MSGKIHPPTVHGATPEKYCIARLVAAAENLTGCFLSVSRRAGVRK
jgi:hypothetical protein